MAWFIHKYIMHGFLWSIHKTHHQKSRKKSFLEWNDVFFLFYAFIGMGLIINGIATYNYAFFTGLGITCYGLTYLIVHDVFVHRRLKWFSSNSSNNYLKAVKKAHQMHHRQTGKDDSEAFGLLWVNSKYYQNKQDFKK